ncbi:hypothetical protein JM93_03812 [Roseibium hamelinense]|uniref:Uncharacterized protein n=1 Tax=Roseibium hamelinense TaxID=150831 RepID=A0A562SMG7_9HYPH|nr:hypothetical protein JM93_03812 [Roseibium hamelinense]
MSLPRLGYIGQVLFRPALDCMNERQQARSFFGELILNPQRHFIKSLAKDQAIGFQIAEGLRQHFLRNTLDLPLQRTEPHRAVLKREYFLTFDVQSAAPRLTLPFLMIHGPNALNPARADKFYSAVIGQKQRAAIQSKGQTDIYDDPAIVRTAASQAAAFLKEALGS